MVNFARELGDQTAASFESDLAGRCARHERNFLVESADESILWLAGVCKAFWSRFGVIDEIHLLRFESSWSLKSWSKLFLQIKSSICPLAFFFFESRLRCLWLAQEAASPEAPVLSWWACGWSDTVCLPGSGCIRWTGRSPHPRRTTPPCWSLSGTVSPEPRRNQRHY